MQIDEAQEKRDLIAQWAFDTRPILGRFHIWLEDVEIEWLRGKPYKEFTREICFMGGAMERQFAMTAAVTSLGTRLFGGFGQGAGQEKKVLNQVKKDADAISAYALSESLWYLSRQLPENHAIMVCLGEGLMPKAGETPEMGSNPQLGFGRVYARPQVARQLDRLVTRLLNDPSFKWPDFYSAVNKAGLTVWGAAIDTLENTSRFAKGAETGAMTIVHLFNQPLVFSRPYEGYMGNLFLPGEVVRKAAQESILINFRTRRELVLKAILAAYPDLSPSDIHVWTLGGKSREKRIGKLWQEWKELGVHLVDDEWTLPSGMKAFTESGTYAPVYSIGSWFQEGRRQLFICDGYAASAEAVQAATLGGMLDVCAFLCPFTSRFDLSYEQEQLVMDLQPEKASFAADLGVVCGRSLEEEEVRQYSRMIQEARQAGLPLARLSLQADDFFPEKSWELLALSGYMCPDPYSGASGVIESAPGIYRVSVRLAAPAGEKLITFTLRLMENMEESWLVFNPLLNRFLGGIDYRRRPVKISDSGRIRNELQTLCVEALEFLPDNRIKVVFARIPEEVISREKQKKLLEILTWYKSNHPIWFSWLEIA